MRSALLLLVPFFCAACASSGATSSSTSSTSEDAPERTSRSASSSDRASTKGSGEAPAAAGDATDLSAKGLPITIRLPRCADGAAPKIREPMVKIADNASDRIISCDVSDDAAIDGKQDFAIQLGPSAGKETKKEIQDDLDFVKFLSEDPKKLEWQSKLFNQMRRNFMIRVSAGGKEYACFSQYGVADEKLYRAELDACESIAAK